MDSDLACSSLFLDGVSVFVSLLWLSLVGVGKPEGFPLVGFAELERP